MRCELLAGATVLLLTITASAQNDPPPAVAVPVANSAAPGDHWSYEVKDEISGEIKETRTFTVTDISKNEIAVRGDSNRRTDFSDVIYDQSWNVVRGPIFKFSPNDGSGIKIPLTLDSQWKSSINATNINNGQVWKRTNISKVTGQEKVTTKAGTFDAFVIETNTVIKNVVDPTLGQEVTFHTWYSPDVNHWIKRAFVVRQNGRVFQSETMELTAYGRKKT